MKEDRLLEMEVFKAVAEHGSFTAAADALGASQPSVSRIVTRLEERFGVALLSRSTRQLRLTDEGRLFLQSCQRILNEVEHAESQLSATAKEPAGMLRINAPTSFGMDQIVPLLPEFMKAFPAISLRLWLSDDFADLIGNGTDVAIRMGRLQDSGLRSRKLCDLQRIVVASPSYIATHGMPKTPDELRFHNCLMREAPMEHLNHWPFLVGGRQVKVEVQGNFYYSNGISSVDMCIAGVGLVRMSEHFSVPAIRKKLLVPLLTDFQARDDTAIYALYPSDRYVHPRIRAFIDYLVQKFSVPPWA